MKQEAVIFDLFGVLFYLRIQPILKDLGVWNLTYYFLRHGKTPFGTFFAILEKMRTEMPDEFQDKATYQGRFLPDSICKWQRGMISNNDMLQRLITYIDQLDKEKFFSNAWEKELIIKSAHAAFDSKSLLEACILNNSVAHVVKKLKHHNHPLYVLSNIDQEIYEELKQRYHHFFGQFNGVVTSFETKLLKPEKEIFIYLVNRYELQPHRCCFIDDQKENVKAAESIGMKTILYRKGENLFRQLKKVI